MPTEQSSHIFKSVSLIMVFTVVFKILGFCREFLLSYYWGTSGVSDAFLISQTIPGTLFQFVGAGLTTCFIPVYYAIRKSDGSSSANLFTNKLTTLILLFSTILITFVWIDTPLFVKVFASGFKDETLDMACSFTRIGILSLYFSTYAFVYESYLQAHRIFVPPVASSVLQSILVLVSLYLGAVVNIWFLPVGCALSIGIRVLFMHPYTKKHELKLKLIFHWNDSNLKRFAILLGPVVIGCAVNDINVIFDRTIASQVTSGAISALTYGNSLIQLLNGGVVLSITTVFYPYITEQITEKKYDEASGMLKQTNNLLLAIFIPITLLFMLLSRQIVDALFGRGAFGEESVSLTSDALFYYSIGICFIALREMISKYYYATGNTKTPMYNAAIGVVFNIVLNFILSRIMGVGGLALSTSISAFVTVFLLVYQAKEKANISAREMVDYIEILKSAIACVIMVVFLLFGYNVFKESSLLCLMVCFPVSVLVYSFAASLLKMESYNVIKALVLKTIEKR